MIKCNFCNSKLVYYKIKAFKTIIFNYSCSNSLLNNNDETDFNNIFNNDHCPYSPSILIKNNKINTYNVKVFNKILNKFDKQIVSVNDKKYTYTDIYILGKYEHGYLNKTQNLHITQFFPVKLKSFYDDINIVIEKCKLISLLD